MDRESSIIHNRYQIKNVLGKGGMGVTYAAIDLDRSQLVAIKVVSLRQAENWKVLELFEREAEILASLDCCGIPKYIDYFELDTKSDRSFYLVRELIKGRSLAELGQKKDRYNEGDIVKIALQVLDILIYLHSFKPPVIHRDIKPENIIYQSNGIIYLVDFGAVQAVFRNPNSFISTFVGTLGYMPPEQFSGNVYPASDLYSLGCTLLFLLTKRSPVELPTYRLKIDFSEAISSLDLSDGFVEWLSKMLEPMFEDRFQSAEEAKSFLLEINQKVALRENNKHVKFIESEGLVTKFLTAEIKQNNLNYAFKFISLADRDRLLPSQLNFITQQDNTLFISCSDTHDFYPEALTINKEQFILTLNASEIRHSVVGKVSDLVVSVIKKEKSDRDKDRSIYCSIFDGLYHYKFGANLDANQRELVVAQINNFIDRYK